MPGTEGGLGGPMLALSLTRSPTRSPSGNRATRSRRPAAEAGKHVRGRAPLALAGAEESAPLTPVLARPSALPTGSTVAVHVEDQGSGIEPEALKTIFEPFFTTKQGGTGLGLYITYDIVKRHGGNLTVNTETGRGTRFTVELPVESNGGLP